MKGGEQDARAPSIGEKEKKDRPEKAIASNTKKVVSQGPGKNKKGTFKKKIALSKRKGAGGGII